MTRSRIILLVEDNPDDAQLTLRAFKRSNVANEIVVVRDGAEALDYLFLTGTHAGRDPTVAPEVVLLDLKLPKNSPPTRCGPHLEQRGKRHHSQLRPRRQ
jgi:two-component system response regulator